MGWHYRTFLPDVTLVYGTKIYITDSIASFRSVHQHGRCAFVFLILRE